MRSNEHLTSAEVYFEAGVPYIKLEYEYESDNGTHRIVFPKVEFPFTTCEIPDISFGYSGQFISRKHAFRRLKLFRGVAQICTEDKIVARGNVTCLDALIAKKKVHEMTLEEIEKKLGYSVKIVTKESKND